MGKRSSGCITCRRRKVKCDEAKPKCERCRKATYACAGYDQPWLDEAPFEREAQERKRVRDQLYDARLVAFLTEKVAAAQGFLPFERVAQELNLSAFSEHICRSFLYHRLCAGQHFSKGISWMLNPAPRVEIQSRTLVSAGKAAAAAFFGRIHRQPRVQSEGDAFYGEALRNLRSDLSHPVKRLAFETLGATMALNLYELIHLNPTSSGCITHAGGIEKLIESRGPALHKSYPEKEVYGQARMIIVANAMFACRKTFLIEQKWKTIPWEDDVSEKNEFDRLVDILSDIPYFLQEVARANTSTATGSAQRPDRISLQKQLLERLRTLKQLREAWHIRYLTPLWRVPVASSLLQGPDSIRPPFDEAIHFTNIFRAYDFCAFQMALILLFLLYKDLSPENLQPIEDILPGVFPNGSIQLLVCNICRCTDYLCLEENGSRGYIILQLPATIAYLAMDRNTPEAKWLYDVCKKRAISMGFGWGDFAMDKVTRLSQWLASSRNRNRNRIRTVAPEDHVAVQEPFWAWHYQERAIRIVPLQSGAGLPIRAGTIVEEGVGDSP